MQGVGYNKLPVQDSDTGVTVPIQEMIDGQRCAESRHSHDAPTCHHTAHTRGIMPSNESLGVHTTRTKNISAYNDFTTTCSTNINTARHPVACMLLLRSVLTRHAAVHASIPPIALSPPFAAPICHYNRCIGTGVFVFVCTITNKIQS